MSDLIYNTIIQIYTFESTKEIYAFQNYMDLPLLLPDNLDRINITELLDIYFNSENSLMIYMINVKKNNT